VKITVVDYDRSTLNVHHLTNTTLPTFLTLNEKMTKCRWINVQGMSFDVVRDIANFYDIHPLAVEDMFHIPQRAKTDYYPHFSKLLRIELIVVYNSVMLLSLGMSDETVVIGSGEERMHVTFPVNIEDTSDSKLFLFKTLINRQKSSAEQCSFFLFDSNVVISFFQSDGSIITDQLYSRLRAPNLPIRMNEESSFLIHGLLDGVIDHYFPIVEYYATQINDMHALGIIV